jgi:hypothetical protein
MISSIWIYLWLASFMLLKIMWWYWFFEPLLLFSKVGDVLNFFSAVFFGIHMLRTEQISRSTDKKKFLSLLSFEVMWTYNLSHPYTVPTSYQLWCIHSLTNPLTTRSLWWLSPLYFGLCSKMATLIPPSPALNHGLLVCFGIQQLHFLGYQHCTLEFFLRCYVCGQRLVDLECCSSFRALFV